MNFFKTRVFIAAIFFLAGMMASWVWTTGRIAWHVYGPHSQRFENRPMDSMGDMMSEMMRSFGGDFGMGASNLRDEGDRYVLEIDLEGLRPENFSVQVENGQLLVEGILKSADEDAVASSQFRQFFAVPTDVEADKIQIDTTDERLTVTLPKAR